MNVELLKRNANKHKKFLENNVMINPFGYEVNGVSYYLVVYKRGQKPKGYTVISEKEYSEVDAHRAFEKLILFTAYVNKFFEIEKMKMKLSPESFSNISSLLERFADNNDCLNKGKEVIDQLNVMLIELQERINKYTHHYDNHVLVNNVVDNKEIQTVLEALSHINRLQYQQGKVLIDSYGYIKEMYKELKKLDLLNMFNDYDQKVINELASGVRETEKSIKEFTQEEEIEHLPVEKQTELILKDIEKVGQEKLPRYKQDLRYPKP